MHSSFFFGYLKQKSIRKRRKCIHLHTSILLELNLIRIMNQDNSNIKVKIDELANNIILQVIINSNSQALLYEKEETKPSVEDIDRRMRQDMLAIGMDDCQLPFPDFIIKNYGLSFSPANDCLQAFFIYEDEVGQMYKNEPCLFDKYHAACESYFCKLYKNKGIRQYFQDLKTQYNDHSFKKRDNIDSWLFEQWNSGKYPLESIRLLVGRLSLYYQKRIQDVHSESCEVQEIMKNSTIPEIEAMEQQWKEMSAISRFFKGKKLFNAYTSKLSDYYLQRLQIEIDDCLSSFFAIMMNSRLETLQTTVDTIYDILCMNNKQSAPLLTEKNIFSDLAPIIEKEHLSLSNMGMSSMTDVLNSLLHFIFPEGNERIKELREVLSNMLIGNYLHQLITEYGLTFDTITDDSGVEYTPDKRILLKAPRNLESYYIPDGVAIILDSAFADVTSLAYIKIPEGVCSIGQSAFQGCSTLKEVIVPKSVTQIGDHAFRGCTQLENVVFLYRDITLNDGWFDDCPALKQERIMTFNSVLTGWIFDDQKRTGIHKETGIELRYCFDNGNGTVKTELVDLPARMKALRAQGYSQEEIDVTFRKVGREFVILCRSL